MKHANEAKQAKQALPKKQALPEKQAMPKKQVMPEKRALLKKQTMRKQQETQKMAEIRYQRVYARGGNPFYGTFRSSMGANLSATDIFRMVNELQWKSFKK